MRPSSLTLSLLFSLTLSGILAQPPYLSEKIEAIVPSLLEMRGEVMEVAKPLAVDPDLVLAVIGPELIRYEQVRDLLETSALELGYVRLGSDQVDFSIGRFQMKPSFAEQVEQIWQNVCEDEGISFAYPPGAESSVRAQRLQRLSSQEWQLCYAVAVCALLLQHPAWRDLGEEASVRRIATAYNFGFQRPLEEIVAWQSVEAFPFGRRYRGEQMAYAAVSWQLYQQLKNRPLLSLTQP